MGARLGNEGDSVRGSRVRLPVRKNASPRCVKALPFKKQAPFDGNADCALSSEAE